MAGVIPVWHLQEILELQELVMKRRKDDEEITVMKNRSGVVNDHAQPKGFTKADFEAALRKTARGG